MFLISQENVIENVLLEIVMAIVYDVKQMLCTVVHIADTKTNENI